MTGSSSRRHAVSLVTPTTEPRRVRRARTRAERSLRTTRPATDADLAPQGRAVQPVPIVPRAGERRRAAGRNWRPLRVQTHKATSATLAAAYPFLAEAGLGGAGILIGTDAYSRRSFVYDPWVLYEQGVITNPNLAVAGEIGAGKSALLKSLVTRSLCFGRRAYVPGDPKGEWTPVTRAVGGTVVELGPGMPARINPLDAGTRPPGTDDDEWCRDVRTRRLTLLTSLAETLLGRGLRPVEHTAVAAALDATAATGDPVLPQVVQGMLEPNEQTPLPPGVTTADRLAEDGREVAHALARLVFGDLVGLFDTASTVRFDPAVPMMSVDVSRIGEDNPLVPLVMSCASAWLEAALRDPSGGRRWMVYDEAWAVMRNSALVRRMETQWRLSRAWGLANILAVHQLADFAAVGDAGSEARARATALLALTSTRVMYRQQPDQLAATATAMGLNPTETSLLPTLVRGQALWRVGTRGFVVDHLLTDREAAVFDTDARLTRDAS